MVCARWELLRKIAEFQFPMILAAMLCGSIPISILGTNFAMAQHPFWQPDQYGVSASTEPLAWR